MPDEGRQKTLVHGPCLGDYPHIGADANGFYITTNEFYVFRPDFHRLRRFTRFQRRNWRQARNGECSAVRHREPEPGRAAGRNAGIHRVARDFDWKSI